jgi:predicted HTH domain antitoxin
MASLTIPYDEDLLMAAGKSPEEFEHEIRVFLAAKLFEAAKVSLGRAARMAGLPKVVFMDELSRLRVSWVNWDDDELRAELDSV